MSNGQFRAPWRNRPKPAPPERTLSDFWRPADQITLSKIAIFGGGRLFAIQNTSHLAGPLDRFGRCDERRDGPVCTVAHEVHVLLAVPGALLLGVGHQLDALA